MHQLNVIEMYGKNEYNVTINYSKLFDYINPEIYSSELKLRNINDILFKVDKTNE